MGPVVRPSLSNVWLDLTDVTLADEDTKSKLTDNAKKAIQGNEAMHYRLRGSIGFLNAQKKSKSKRLFLTQGTPKYDNFALFVKIMTQICTKKISQLFQIANMAKIMVNVQKRLNGASVEADFWHSKNIQHLEKKALNKEFY